MGTSRNLVLPPVEYAKRLWDWTPFNDCFNYGIRISDVDGIVERKGRFLILEGKPPDKPLSKGQRILFERLARLEGFTVIIIRGYPPRDVIGWQVIGKGNYDGGLDDLRKFVRRWFEWADDQKGDK